MNRKKRISVLLLGLLLLALLGSISAEAEEKKGSVTIDYSVENHTRPIAGASFGIIKVEKQKDFSDPQSEQGIEAISEDEKKDPDFIAKKILENCKTFRAEKMTGKDGKVLFTDLEDGKWLIVQTGRSGDAEQYEMSKASLVSLPMQQDGKISREITIYPKTTKIETKHPNPTETVNMEAAERYGQTDFVQTGDSAKTGIWMLVMILSALGCVFASLEKRRTGI